MPTIRNPAAITAYIEAYATDPQMEHLFVLALDRALVAAAGKEIFCFVDPDGSGDLIFDADDMTFSDHVKVHRVIDWIEASVAADAAWLHETDDLGQPLKLVAIETLEQALAEVDKASLPT